jgi:hypothetical protein
VARCFSASISPLGLLWERIIHHSNFYGKIKIEEGLD